MNPNLKGKVNKLVDELFQVVYDASNDKNEYVECLRTIKKRVRLEFTFTRVKK